MYRSFQRRAFLTTALLALGPLSATPAQAADGGSLWDLLSRTDHTALALPPPGAQTFDPANLPRRALGPVPGFTLPAAPGDGSDDNDPIFSKHKKRHSGPFGYLGDWFDNLEQKTGSKVVIRGHSDLSLHYDMVSGSQDAYLQEQYYGQGGNGFYNDSDLSVDATLFKYLTYKTEISNSPFHNANDNRLNLDYDTKKTRIQAGDINAGFQGNPLIDFSRYLHGVMISDNWTPKFKTSVLFSQTKAETRTIVIPGNNSSGPYYVYAGQIVDGSVQVRVDQKTMTEGANNDYTLDPYTGQLNFTKGQVILQTSSIAVSFETLGYGVSEGSIYGGRVDFIPRKNMSFGVTYVAETAQGGGLPQQQQDLLHGFDQPSFNTSTFPYTYTTNAPIDLSKPVSVKVNNIPLVTGVDYVVDTSTAYTNRVFLKQPVPFTTIVEVDYFPYNPNPVAGNRSVLGIDSRIGLGKIGSVTIDGALSGLELTGNNIVGKAVQAQASLTPFKGDQTRITIKDIGTTYSSIQSPGFNQNEKSLDISSDYQVTKALHLSVDWERAKRPDYSGADPTGITAAGYDDYSQYSLGAVYKMGKYTNFNLTRSSISTAFAQGGDSTNVNNAVSVNYSRGALQGLISLSTNSSDVLSTYALLGLTPPTTGSPSLNSLLNASSDTVSERASLQYQASKWLTLSGSFSNNTISNSGSGSDSSGTARDEQLTADFRLIRNLKLQYSYDLSDTGNSVLGGTAATTGTTTGTAIGTGLGTLVGGGANTGLGGLGNYSTGLANGLSNYGLTSFGGESATNRLSLDYHASKAVQISAHIDKADSVGDYQYNSNRNGFGLDLSWQASSRFQFHASYQIDNLAYVGSLGGSNTNTMLLSLQGKPFGRKLDFMLNFQRLVTNSSFNFASTTGTTTPVTTTPVTPVTGTTTTTAAGLTDTSSDLTSINFRLEYPINPRETLFTEWLLSDSGGYYANKENDIKFGLDYNLTSNLKFSLGWQILSHIYANTGATAISTASLNYKVSSILAEFGFHF